MTTTSRARLSIETEFYESQKSEWLKDHRTEFAVVKGTDLLGLFSEFHQAYSAGAEQYGIDADFLIKRVLPKEAVFAVF